MYFPIVGVNFHPLIPVFVGAVAALIFGQVGLAGGIATLPFMVSVLNFTSPSVNSTNLIFVMMSPIGSVYSYRREKRIVWRLGVLAGVGGIAGAIIGPRIRVELLSDILRFKTLFGVLLLFIGLQLLLKTGASIKVGKVESSGGSFWRPDFIFAGSTYTYSTPTILLAGMLAGIISTTFGLGTGFLLVPFYTTVLKFPIYAITGSVLFSTLMISSAGTIIYSSLNTGVSTTPDIGFGLLLGIGGVLGGFASARAQRHITAGSLQRLLGLALFLWAMNYLRHGF